MKKSKRLLALLLSVLMLVSIVPLTAISVSAADTAAPVEMKKLEGSGTKDDPYLVADVEDWSEIAIKTQGSATENKLANTYFKQVADLDFTEVMAGEDALDYIIAETDGDRKSTTGYYFSGNYDGNGYTISGFNYKGARATIALFGYVIGATIENVTLVDSTITLERSSVYAAGIAASVGGSNGEKTTIRNCVVADSVTIKHSTPAPVGEEKAVTSNYRIGGIVGDATCDANNIAHDIRIENCYSGLNFVSDEYELKGSTYVAGILGNLTGWRNTAVLNVDIVNCTANLKFKFENTSAADLSHTGNFSVAGIVAQLTDGKATPNDSKINIENCYGTVNADFSSKTATMTFKGAANGIGGIIGASKPDTHFLVNVKDCDTNVTVTKTDKVVFSYDANPFGGIVGKADGFDTTRSVLNISGCTFNGVDNAIGLATANATNNVTSTAKSTTPASLFAGAAVQPGANVNVALKLPKASFAKNAALSVEVKVGNVVTVVPSADWTESGDNYLATVAIAPKDLGNVLVARAVVVDGNNTVYSSPFAYAIDKTVPTGVSGVAKTALENAIAFAAAAKAYFAGKDVSAPTAAPADISANAPTRNNAYIGATLVLGDKTDIRIYLNTDSVSGKTYTVDGKAVTPVEKKVSAEKTVYYIEIADIDAKDFDKKFTVVIDGTTVEYSVLGYCQTVLANAEADANLANLVKTLVNYYTAAKANA